MLAAFMISCATTPERSYVRINHQYPPICNAHEREEKWQREHNGHWGAGNIYMLPIYVMTALFGAMAQN